MFFLDKLKLTIAKEEYTVQLNRSVTLNCAVSGKPPPYSVYWVKIKDGTEIIVKHESTINRTSIQSASLTINDAEDKHAGIYKCIAVHNNSNVQSQNIYVYVIGGKVLYQSKTYNMILMMFHIFFK